MESKPMSKSKTIISAIAGLILTFGVSIGVVTDNESEQISTILLQLTPYAGIILSLCGAIYGRIKAKGDINKIFS